MSDYVQHSWTPGQIITPSKMNNIEGGIVSLEENIEEITRNIETIEGDITNLQNEIDNIEVEEWGTHEVISITEDAETFNASKILAQTNGHVHYYKTNERPIVVYDNENSPLTGTRMGSKKIKINSLMDTNQPSNYVYIIMSPDSTSGCYINFYNENDELVHKPNFFEYNSISVGNLSKLNGCLFDNIPLGWSIEVAPYDNTAYCTIIIWDGQPCSYPVTAATRTISIRNNIIEVTSWSNDYSPIAATIQIPGNTRFLLAKPGYTFIDMYNTDHTINYRVSNSTYRFPCQGMRTAGFSGGGRVKNVTVVKDYDYNKQLAEQDYKEIPNGDLSANIIALDGYDIYTQESASGYAGNRVQYKINCILDFNWECQKNINTDAKDNTRQFKRGITYHGVPYRSDWAHACHPGWHITKHTFLNAVSDPNSIFYEETPARGPYYSLVCSDFATLVTGFPAPMTNWSMMHSPDVYVKKTSVVPIGECVTNGTGHVFVPIKINTTHNGRYIVTIAEQEGPITKVNNVMSGVPSDYAGVGKKTSYLLNYQFVVNSKKFVNQPPYSIVRGELVNGDAKPYVGDGGVFTSRNGIIINVKNRCNYLHIQKVNAIVGTGSRSGIINKSTSTLIDNALHLDVSNIAVAEDGNKRVILRGPTPTVAGEEIIFLNNDLENYFEDGEIYGVWADNDPNGPRESSADFSGVQFFEWHDIHTNNDPTHNDAISYHFENGELKIEEGSSDFWYATSHAHNYAHTIKSTAVTGGLTILPAPKQSIDGQPLENQNDYSRYTEEAYFDPNNGDTVYNFFKKGRLGAYTALITPPYSGTGESTEDKGQNTGDTPIGEVEVQESEK